jgi:hypothetical protein
VWEALALQDTLSNLFAGVYIRLDSPVRLADYTKLDGGNESFAVQIGWRSTRIRTLPNNSVVVPNTKLARAMITDYYKSDERGGLRQKSHNFMSRFQALFDQDAFHFLRIGASRPRRIVAGFHSDMPGRDVRGSISGPAA